MAGEERVCLTAEDIAWWTLPGIVEYDHQEKLDHVVSCPICQETYLKVRLFQERYPKAHPEEVAQYFRRGGHEKELRPLKPERLRKLANQIELIGLYSGLKVDPRPLFTVVESLESPVPTKDLLDPHQSGQGLDLLSHQDPS